MKKRGVVIFLLLLLIIAIFCIFAQKVKEQKTISLIEEYRSKIQTLDDTIQSLKGDICRYAEIIDKMSKEREDIQKQVRQIIADNAKTDSILDNGNWDDHIGFLSDYLSQEDSSGEGHGVGDNIQPVGDNKQGSQQEESSGEGESTP